MTYFKSKKKRKAKNWPSSLLTIFLAILAIFWMIPFVFMILTSLKSSGDIAQSPPWALPKVWEFHNFKDSWVRGDLKTVGFNSLIVVLIKVPLGLVISSLSAFALSRLKLRRSSFVLGVFVIGAMIPIQIGLGPLFGMINDLNLLNTRLGLILPYLAFGIPTQTFMFYNFFKSVPMELDEAANIDGAGAWRLYWNIITPISKPVFGALFILDFVATWNEFAMASTLMQDQKMYLIPQAIQNFNTQYVTSWGQVNAFVISTMLPVLVMYLIFQRFFSSGALSGAVKG